MHKKKNEGARSLYEPPGGNLVDGLPPASSQFGNIFLKFNVFEISEISTSYMFVPVSAYRKNGM